MNPTNLHDDPLYLKISAALDKVCDRIEDTIHKQHEQLEARRKRTELQTQVAAQKQLQSSLSSRLAGEVARADELARVTRDLGERLAITGTDNARLHNAREMYQVGKELTGIRWDFGASPDLARGYVKSSSRKLLEWFSVPAGELAGEHAGALWARVAFHPAKENVQPHH